MINQSNKTLGPLDLENEEPSIENEEPSIENEEPSNVATTLNPYI